MQRKRERGQFALNNNASKEAEEEEKDKKKREILQDACSLPTNTSLPIPNLVG